MRMPSMVLRTIRLPRKSGALGSTRARPVCAVTAVKQQKRSILDPHTRSDDATGFTQVLTTLLPLAALWVAVTLTAPRSYGLTAIATVMMSFFLLRSFALMHECGHGSLFRSSVLNQVFGFVFGVVSGMPQYVWSRHHSYHHATNGNWAKYRGPLAILTVDEYDALSRRQQRAYVRARNICMAPLAGFVYVLLNPRLTWLRGSANLAWHLIRVKIAEPGTSIRMLASEFRTPYWESAAEYRHMSLNNLVLLSAWASMSWLIGRRCSFPSTL